MESTFLKHTTMGDIKGLSLPDQYQFLGVTYAKAKRFTYASPVERWEGTLDATHYGDACIQKRVWYEHLEIPERLFYHNEFRKGIDYSHSEDCLNLNIYTPKSDGPHPVLVYIHGGGFDSGCNYDTCINGKSYPAKDIVFVSINYRVGVFGYFTHEEIKNTYGHEGNFGLDDQYVALKWIKEHIHEFGGDPQNITVMGQSAGAISIQYLCLSEKCRGLFSRVIMQSGGGLFPKFSLPKPAEDTREYWQDVMQSSGASSFEEFKQMDAKKIFDTLEDVKARRKDNTYNTMPVIDQYLLTDSIDKLITHPLPVDYMLGYTNNDMFAPIMAHINHKYAKANNAYLYYFDIDAPGEDQNGAFHSSDLRYVFGTLDESHRPYGKNDHAVSEMMISYISNYVAKGDPNYAGAPTWKKGGRNALCIVNEPGKIKMGRPSWGKLVNNMIKKGDPK